jgi:hypothetical protein
LFHKSSSICVIATSIPQDRMDVPGVRQMVHPGREVIYWVIQEEKSPERR